jgi:hypothetical protein
MRRASSAKALQARKKRTKAKGHRGDSAEALPMRKAATEENVMGMGHREDSAEALPARKDVTERCGRKRSSQRLSQSLASAEWCHERVYDGPSRRLDQSLASAESQSKQEQASPQVRPRRVEVPALRSVQTIYHAGIQERHSKVSRLRSWNRLSPSVARGRQQEANAASGKEGSREGDVESGGWTTRNGSNTYHLSGCRLEAVQCSFGRRMIRCSYLTGTTGAVTSLSRSQCGAD